MQTIRRSPGVRVTIPETWVVETADSPRPRTRGVPARAFGPVPMPATATGTAASDLVAALEAQEMTVVDQIELRAAPPAPGTRREAAGEPISDSATLEVDLAPDENAVVLLEQDGMFSWNFPAPMAESESVGQKVSKSESSSVTHSPTESVRKRAAPLGRTARFDLSFNSAPPAGGQRRGLVSDFLFGQARAFVLKFVARAVTGAAVKFLERNVRRGLVLMDSDDPLTWRLVDDMSHPATAGLPKDRPARVLLFVHGTFSSTAGSFGALGATPWGREFLAAARANYDAVIGFDHSTLGEDPVVNAKDLLRRLDAQPWPHAPRIDAISYSRGGIVLRSLLEHLLPTATLKVAFERSVFVGVVNNGTLLAEPENWHTLVDLYTNLAAAACRAIALMPQATFGAALLRETIQGVGAFVKHLATQAVTEGGIPGLAAMQPKGEFIRTLNETQPGQATAADSQFFAITSNFTPRLVPENAKDLPRQLVLALANGFVDQLFGEANDLVVNKASMTAIDEGAGQFIKDQLDFGENGVVYHTNYFLQPQTVNALARWLQLQAPKTASPTRLRSTVAAGGATPLEIPATVDTDVVVVRADAAAADAREQTLHARASYVVVERPHQGKLLHYAFPAEEVLARTEKQPRASMLEALDLHEYQASTAGPAGAMPALHRKASHSTARRGVALDNERVVGVVPESAKPMSVDELIILAERTAAPKTESDFVVRRRGLPTFAAPTQAAGAAPSEAPVAAPPKVTCHFRAEMDDEVQFGSVATIEVSVSREVLEHAARAGAAGGTREVDPTRKLIIQVVPKLNFACVGESRAEIDPPSPAEPTQLYFDVQPTRKCEGEIWVVIRQGQVPLVTLILKPRIVAKVAKMVRRLNAPASTSEAEPLTEPVHELSIFEQRNGNEVRYHFIFDSPALGLKNSYYSPPLAGDRVAYVNALYQEIEKRWVSNKDDVEAFNEELRAFGGQLWDELFPPELQRDLWQHRDRIRSVWVFSEEPFIPWELVHMKEPGKPLGAAPLFLAQIGLVRWLHNIGLPPQQLRFRAGRCFYVIPDYPHPKYKLKSALEESAFLKKEFAAAPIDPFPNPVRKLLAGPGSFDLLHFACHGEASLNEIANAQLVLQGRVEGSNYIPEYLSSTTVEQFANLLGADGLRPTVVINACQAGRAGYQLSGIGGFARAFLRHDAGLFVGTLWSVGDSPARDFTEEFYSRLMAGDRVSAATIAAREKARQAGEGTWLAYAVYGHPHATLTRS